MPPVVSLPAPADPPTFVLPAVEPTLPELPVVVVPLPLVNEVLPVLLLPPGEVVPLLAPPPPLPPCPVPPLVSEFFEPPPAHATATATTSDAALQSHHCPYPFDPIRPIMVGMLSARTPSATRSTS